MSRRLRERHEDLLRDEVRLQPVKRSGSFRVALCYPNLYFVGMSNLGFQSVYQMLNAHPDVLCERAFLPDDVDREDLERIGAAPDQPRERLATCAASTWWPSRSPSRTTTCTSCRCCAWPGSRCGRRTAGPAIPW